MNFKYMVLAAATVLSLSGCNDFFKESSQDEIKPTTTNDLAAVLYREAYPYYFNTDAYLVLLTDEVQSNGCTYENYKSRQEDGQYVFSFDPEMFDGYKTFIDDENSWKNYYQLIMGCNVILDDADAMTGSNEDKNNLKGQAKLLRAYYYLQLAMIYCQPYRNNPDTNLGLTLITTAHVNDTKPKRSTLRETYDFIESNLLEAREMLKNYQPTTCYRVTKTAADILLSRFYLYEEKWDKSIEYATYPINEGPALTNFSQLSGTYNVYQKDGSSEVVWNYGGAIYDSPYFNTSELYWGHDLPYSASKKVENLYDQVNDLRYKKYFSITSGYQCDYVHKIQTNSQYDGEHGVRMAEAYLNRAESYAHKSDADDALKDVNALRKTRYAAGSNYAITDVTSDQLLQTVLDERQREFVWEDGFRWMDIKRLGLSVTHVFTDENGTKSTHVLKSNDLLYALPIPNDAFSRNTNLQQNPRQ